MPGISLLARLAGALCVSVPMLVLAVLIPGAFGGGDIKLMAACGLFLGWKITLVSTALAILFGGIYGCYLLAAKKADRKAHFAFGPFLCIGMAIGLLYGIRPVSYTHLDVYKRQLVIQPWRIDHDDRAKRKQFHGL